MPPDNTPDNAPEDNPILKAARERRAKAQTELDKLVAKPAKEARALEDGEATRFEELVDRIKKLDKQIRNLEAETERRAKAAETNAGTGSAPAVVKREMMTYGEGSPYSFFRDMAFASARSIDPSYMRLAEEADKRMLQHMHEVEIEARNDSEIRRRLQELRATPPGMEQRTNPNTTAGTGGEFVPPLWLVSQYVPYARPGRIFANRLRNLPLPPGTDIINLPKITVGSQAGIQTANAAAVTSVDIQTSTVSAPVRTIAGQEDISMQL